MERAHAPYNTEQCRLMWSIKSALACIPLSRRTCSTTICCMGDRDRFLSRAQVHTVPPYSEMLQLAYLS